MERLLIKEEEEKIINCGAFGYNYEQTAAVLDWDLEELKIRYNEDKSTIKKLYERGKHKADYVIDCKLFELSQSGDLKALETFRVRTGKNDQTRSNAVRAKK